MKNITVFASGRGSNFQTICEHSASGYIPGNVNLLVASKPDIGACGIAERFSVPVYVYAPKEFASRQDADRALLHALQEHGTDYIALAGWLKLISTDIVSAFPFRMVNIHPALLPFFGGKGMYGHHVHEAVRKSGMQVSGATVHFVNERYDEGHILLQRAVAISTTDTPDEIAERVLKIEHEIYPEALKLLLEDRVHVADNRVILEPAE